MSRVEELKALFTEIHQQRMQGLPFLNPRLEVDVVGFGPWRGDSLGVLITPWFINLVLLPGDEGWGPLKVGDKVLHEFGSGAYEFIIGHEEGFGFYQMCSLFSPVQEFADQDAAMATAAAAINALMDTTNQERLRSQSLDEADTETEAVEEMPSDRNLSRRQLLRGQLGQQA